uniref:Uncharacterized protein n=1 Tax=Rhizophora mucronata TaxID=61149 RepID=A0A2P2QS71_RHIMU
MINPFVLLVTILLNIASRVLHSSRRVVRKKE